MKVLLIDVNCKNSSTGEIVYNLYSFLCEEGHEAAICYGRGQTINERNIFKFGLDWETCIHALLTRITGYTGCYSYFSTKRLINYIEKFAPDIVHIHELHAYFVNIRQLLEYLAKKNIKVVHTLHCEFSYTGKCGHSVECERWKKECGDCPRIREYPSSLVFDHTKYMHKQKREAFSKIQDLTIVTPSKWLANRAKESFFRDRKIVVINNGIDTSVFYPKDIINLRKKYNICEEQKIVLAVAANLMSDLKGGKYILQIAKKLKDITFFLIGTDEVYERENVISLGSITNKNTIADYYSIADAFIICSKMDNYPTTCLEAKACGTPIVGFDVGGIREIANGENDVLVNYGDVSELISNIERKVLKSSKTKNDYEYEELSNMKAIEKYYEKIYKQYNNDRQNLEYL